MEKNSSDLEIYKIGSAACSLPKEQFPRLLTELVKDLAANGEQNLKSGFRKAGIVPFEKKQVITRLPIYDDNTELDDSGNPLIISQSFLDHLKKSRESPLDGDNKRVRRRKVDIEPGKSVTSADVAKIASEKTSRQNSRKRLKRIHVVCQDATESETRIINKEIGGAKKLKTPEESQEELDTQEVLEGLSETNREPSPDLD